MMKAGIRLISVYIAGFGILLVLTGFGPAVVSDMLPSYYYNKGLTYEQEGRYDRAEKKFQQALRRNPVMAKAHLALGAVYLKTGRIEEAETSLLKVIETLPRAKLWGATYNETLSMTYNNMGVVEEMRAVKAVYRLDLTAAETHRLESRSFYQSALEIDPYNYLAGNNLRQLPGQIKITRN